MRPDASILTGSDVAGGLAVLLEPVAATRGQFGGNVDDQLRGHQKRKQHIVAHFRATAQLIVPVIVGASSGVSPAE